MDRVEKTVFISYRRTDEPWGLAVFQDLTQHGYDVFIDYDGIASGSFEAVILENIRARAHFLVLLTPTALERCGDPNDWMRREIEAALDSQRNIVPLMLAGFDFGTPAIVNQLTGKLAALKQYNGLPIPKGYFSSAMERLRNKFLNVPVDAVLHTASDSAQQIAKEQKDKALNVRIDAVLHTASDSAQQAAKEEVTGNTELAQRLQAPGPWRRIAIVGASVVAVLLLIGVGGYGFIQRMQMAEADLTAAERQGAAVKFPSNDSRFRIMVGTAVKGVEYKSLNTTTIERCSSECAGDTRCKMFAYSESSICYLFDRDFNVYDDSQTQVGYLRSGLPPLEDSPPEPKANRGQTK
jgi:hypothetical protein